MLAGMKLIDYTKQNGGQSALAKKIGVVAVVVHNWVHGVRPIPAERCIDIERVTGGAVTCEELRPDLSERWAFLRGTEKKAA